MSIILDAYLSNDAGDYVYNINRPILHLKTITGGELRAEVWSQRLKDYMGWISDADLKRKIDSINILFRNCPENELSVKSMVEKASRL